MSENNNEPQPEENTTGDAPAQQEVVEAQVVDDQQQQQQQQQQQEEPKESEQPPPAEQPVVEDKAPVEQPPPAEQPIVEDKAPVEQPPPAEQPIVEDKAPIEQPPPAEQPVVEVQAPVAAQQTENTANQKSDAKDENVESSRQEDAPEKKVVNESPSNVAQVQQQQQQSDVQQSQQQSTQVSEQRVSDFIEKPEAAGYDDAPDQAPAPVTPLRRRQLCFEELKKWDLRSTRALNLHSRLMVNMTRYVDEYQSTSQYYVSRYMDFVNQRLHQARAYEKLGVSQIVDIRQYRPDVGAVYGPLNDALVAVQTDCEARVAKQRAFADQIDAEVLQAIVYPNIQNYQSVIDQCKRDIDALKRHLQDLTARAALKSQKAMRVYQAQTSSANAAQLFLDGNQHKKCLYKALHSFLRVRVQIADTQRKLGAKIGEYWTKTEDLERTRQEALTRATDVLRAAWDACNGELKDKDAFALALDAFAKARADFRLGVKFIDPDLANQLDDFFQEQGLGTVSDASVLNFLRSVALTTFDAGKWLILGEFDGSREALTTPQIFSTSIALTLDNFVYCYDKRQGEQAQDVQNAGNSADASDSGNKYNDSGSAVRTPHYEKPSAKIAIDGCVVTVISDEKVRVGPQGNAFVKFFKGQITKDALQLKFVSERDQREFITLFNQQIQTLVQK